MVYELSRLVDADPDLVVWRQGRCLPYGDGVSLWAVAEMVKVQAGILETDPADLALEKLAKSVEALDLQDEAEWIVQRLRPLVGLAEGDAGQVSREEQFAAWRHYLEAVAEAHLAVLVFEDLHWADDTLLDFIDELTTRSTGVPLLVLCTARPELQANRPTWGAGRANALTLSLPPLTGEQTA